ncbi:MAG: HAD-IIIA family hydrolase [Elusimicrobia bacterium]|nr:HAD-IIIA family hydrolase [Elusimicrobiota bacterium]
MTPLVFLLKPPTSPNTLFIDRDGILNHAVTRGTEISSPRSMEEFKITEDIEALVPISRDWNLVVITNQPDITRGLIDDKLLRHFHERFLKHVSLNVVYACPHLKTDGCGCRKPAIGMIQKFRKDFPEAQKKEWFVGDGQRDKECAAAAHMPFILRKRPYNLDLVPSTQFVIDQLWDLPATLSKNKLTTGS